MMLSDHAGRSRCGWQDQLSLYKQDNPRNLLITLPQGIRDSQPIKLKALGEAGKNGGDSGDLYLKVKISRQFAEIIREFIRKLISYLGI